MNTNADTELDTATRDIASIAESYCGICACPSSQTRARIEELLEPYKPLGGWDYRRLSLCGVVAEAWMDRAGWDVPWASSRYSPSTAISRAISWARKTGCWQDYRVMIAPARGDVLILDRPTHECVVLECDGEHVITADGGQTCVEHERVAYQSIRRVTRAWPPRRRRVLGWIVADLAPRRPR